MSPRFKALVLAVAGAAALSGCVTPPAERPQATAIEPAQLGLGDLIVPPAPEGWWKAYGDPQLDGLIAQAYADSPRLALALARLNDASAVVGAAQGRLGPSFSLDGTEIRERLSEHDILPPSFGGRWFWRGDVEANLSWDLDFWGRQAALVESAGAQSDAARLDLEAARLALAGALARSYLQLDHAYQLADLATRAEAQRSALARLTQQRVDAGLDSQVELRAVQAALPLTRVEQRAAQVEIAQAVHALAALSGRGAQAHGQIVRPELDLAVLPPLPASLPANLLLRRPDVQAAWRRVQAAGATQRAAEAAFYPEVNLSAFAGWGAIGLDNLLRSDSAQFGFGPRFHLPIFDSARLKAQFRQANAGVDEAMASYNDTVLHAVQQVADDLSAIAGYEQQLRDQGESLAHSEAAYALAQKRYRAGLATQLTVLNAETQVLEARRQRLDLVSELARSRVALLLALGGSFVPPDESPAVLAAAPTPAGSAVTQDVP